MKEYLTPDFDVTIYEVEDLIAAESATGNIEIDTTDPDGEEWFG